MIYRVKPSQNKKDQKIFPAAPFFGPSYFDPALVIKISHGFRGCHPFWCVLIKSGENLQSKKFQNFNSHRVYYGAISILKILLIY